MNEAVVQCRKRALSEDNAAVFVLDSDETASITIQHIVESVGLPVVVFRSPIEFLDSGLPDVPRCLILELRLPEMSGLALQEVLTTKGIQLPLIFVSGYGCVETAVRAMKKGALDFMSKPINEQRLIDAAFAALNRDRTRRGKAAALAAIRERFASLTPREHEVIMQATAGKLNKQIADELGVSEVMVKVHRSHAMRKLTAQSFAEAVRMTDLARAGFGETTFAPPESPRRYSDCETSLLTL
jgi:FixJ family two-component response regulator